MPTDSPRLIPVPRESLARVLQHAASRAHSDHAEARAWEALQAALDASHPVASTDRLDSMRYALGIDHGSKPPTVSTFAIHIPRPSTIGALLDALRADMERLGIRQIEVTARGIVVDLVRPEVTPCRA